MKKLLIVILIFLLCVNIFTINSFASYTFYAHGYELTMTDANLENCPYILVISLDTDNLYGNLLVVCGTTPIVCSISSNSDSVSFTSVGNKWYSVGTRNFSNSTFKPSDTIVEGTSSRNLPGFEIVFSNFDVKSSSGDILHFSNTTKSPYFITSQEELETGTFDYLKVNSGDFNTYDNEEFYLFSYYYSDNVDDIASIYPRKKILLDGASNKYFVGANSDTTYTYEIPKAELGIDLKEGYQYGFKLASMDSNGVVTDYWDSIVFRIGVVSDLDKELNSEAITQEKLDEQTNAIKDQTEAMKEQTEVNKSIFERIGDILSYINPFSENFFVYKLIELLIEAIKSLFIPSEGFFDTYFTELKDWFSDRLGFLFYPFELVIDILSKILNIDFTNPIFNIPDINEPFSNEKLISATTFNLNSLLENNILKTIHDIYLVCLDAFIIFELVNLFRRKYEEVTTK